MACACGGPADVCLLRPCRCLRASRLLAARHSAPALATRLGFVATGVSTRTLAPRAAAFRRRGRWWAQHTPRLDAAGWLQGSGGSCYAAAEGRRQATAQDVLDLSRLVPRREVHQKDGLRVQCVRVAKHPDTTP